MLITFLCNNTQCANKIEKFFRSHKDVPSFLDCGGCGFGKLERQLGSPSAKSTQVVDNNGLTRDIQILNAVVERESERNEEG